jgi:hypothetical protein
MDVKSNQMRAQNVFIWLRIYTGGEFLSKRKENFGFCKIAEVY